MLLTTFGFLFFLASEGFCQNECSLLLRKFVDAAIAHLFVFMMFFFAFIKGSHAFLE
jgi:hypothetical protein